MTRKARHLEIVIGTFLVLLGLVSSYLVYYDINWRFEFVQNYIDLSKEISVTNILLNWHLAIIVSLLLFFGGMLLTLSQKIGWYFAIISSIYSSLAWTLTSLISSDQDSSFSWIGYIIGLLFLLIVIFLFSKPIRTKYILNGQSYIVVIIAISVLFLDRFLV